MNLFDSLEILPDDPILGLGARYNADPRSNKMDLGVGIYKDVNGHTPVMAAVKLAEQWLVDNEATKAYTSTAGLEGFEAAVGPLLLGAQAGDYSVIQTPGGTGALRLMAEFLHRSANVSRVLIGVPTWPIHGAIFERGGVPVSTYAYLDEAGQFNLPALLTAMADLQRGDSVLLHACCHNPSGIDPTREQWQEILDVMRDKGLLPLFDMAYQGFGDGLDEDAWALRLFCQALPEVLAAASCSKNFGLYRERTGALLAYSTAPRNLAAVKSQLIDCARCLWSMPPAHGAGVVTRILGDAHLHGLWLQELTAMRERINALRHGLCAALQAVDAFEPFQGLAAQRGMFSHLGCSTEMVARLREQSGVYLVGQGRINVSGLSATRLDELAAALKAGLLS